MDFETISADAFGRSLRGLGINLLTRDPEALAAFLTAAFGLEAHRVSADFAILSHDGGLLQLHSHGTFASHPLHALLPEGGVAGGGVQIYLFRCDPDAAVSRAEAAGGTVIEPPADKPHGLREATILSPEGFAFTAATPLDAPET
ncbi:MAG: VOC family protein [Pseudomonadota bacterium]